MTGEIKTIDLFAGAGGLTAGLRKASPRFRPIVAVEFDRAAAATFEANHPSAEVVNRPIQEWVGDGQLPAADVIVGGPPCQGFSALGKQDVWDERNFLWSEYAKVIQSAGPKYFVVENVSQFLKSDQFQSFRAQTFPNGKLRDYSLLARGVVNAAHFGAAQVRMRTVLIGRHRDMPDISLPLPTHPMPDTWRTVRESWFGLPMGVEEVDLPERQTSFNGEWIPGAFKTSELHLGRTYAAISQERIRTIPPGGNRFDIPYHLQPHCWRVHKNGSGDVMGRLSWDRPSVTIRTEFVKPEKGRYLHPTEHRAITLQEGARLQGFDDDYLWCGSKTAIAKQIGNAVPAELAAAIGRRLLEVL